MKTALADWIDLYTAADERIWAVQVNGSTATFAVREQAAGPRSRRLLASRARLSTPRLPAERMVIRSGALSGVEHEIRGHAHVGTFPAPNGVGAHRVRPPTSRLDPDARLA